MLLVHGEGNEHTAFRGQHVTSMGNRARTDVYQTLLLDSGVVELTNAYNPIFVIRSTLKPLFLKGPKNELRALGNIEA